MSKILLTGMSSYGKALMDRMSKLNISPEILSGIQPLEYPKTFGLDNMAGIDNVIKQHSLDGNSLTMEKFQRAKEKLMELQKPKMLFLGLNVFVNDHICIENVYTQFRFPRSKKKRIRKKFFKDKSNFMVSKQHNVILAGDKVFVSNEILQKLKSESMADYLYKERI